jgi:hypothetical protein
MLIERPWINAVQRLSVTELRDLVEEIVSPYIEIHRGSRHATEDNTYLVPEGKMTDDEITDFVLSNPLLDSETAWYLVDPGLLGFEASYKNIDDNWLKEFCGRIIDWAATNEWSSGDLVYYHVDILLSEPEHTTEIWTPSKEIIPSEFYLAESPSHLLLAYNLLTKGKNLSELHWREFEKLIGELLEDNGWKVEVMRGTKDGGVDIVSTMQDPILGSLKALWQAKKYQHNNKVGLASLREFSGILERERATKGIVVTTSTFTKGAIQWVQKDIYRLTAMDGKAINEWVRKKIHET